MGDRVILVCDIPNEHVRFKSTNSINREASRVIHRFYLDETFVKCGKWIHHVYIVIELCEDLRDVTYEDDDRHMFVLLTAVFVDGYDQDEEQVFQVSEFEDLGDGDIRGELDLGDGNTLVVEIHDGYRIDLDS